MAFCSGLTNASTAAAWIATFEEDDDDDDDDDEDDPEVVRSDKGN